MIDLSNFIIEKIEDLVYNDIELKELDITIRDFYSLDVPNYPLIVVNQIENKPRGYSFSKEVYTDYTWQIEIKCQITDTENGTLEPQDACKLISSKVSDYMENTLKLRRLTIMPPIPYENGQYYSVYMRYSGKLNIVSNIISK